jgi:transposase InsO family protein
MSDPTALRSPDPVNPRFTANRADQLWVADFTYLRCHEGLVFFSFVFEVVRQVCVAAGVEFEGGGTFSAARPLLRQLWGNTRARRHKIPRSESPCLWAQIGALAVL